MQSREIEPKRAHKLLAARTLKVWILGASVAVLAVGAWLRPRAERTAFSPQAEQSAPLLEEQVQLREGIRTLRNVQDVAIRVRNHGVVLALSQPQSVPGQSDFSVADDLSQVAGFGVVVSERNVLTHALALAGGASTTALTAENEILEARVAAYDSSSGLVLIQTVQSAGPVAAMARESPVAGTLVVAVARWSGRDIAVPVFITSVRSDRYTLGPVTASVLPGMPLYSLDGELIAIAARDGSETHGIPAREIADRLIAASVAGVPVLDSAPARGNPGTAPVPTVR